MPPFGNAPPTPENNQVRKPRWSEEDINNSEDILHYIKTEVDTNYIKDPYAQASIAARALGHLKKPKQTFRDLPSGVKSYLSYIWKLDSKIHLPSEEEWFAQVNPHTLHPEDEAHIINTLKNNEE